MENQNFVCPHCSKKQQIKKLLLLSNFSKWNCPYCGTEIAPEKKSPVHGAAYGVLGVLSTAVPANYCLYILNYSLPKSMLIAFGYGIICCALIIIYLYKTIKLN
jgi:hypothetical protein